MFRPSRASTIAGIAVVTGIVGLYFLLTGPALPPASAQDKPPAAPQSTAVFDADGKMKLPTGYRAWVFVGAPPRPGDDGRAERPAAASDRTLGDLTAGQRPADALPDQRLSSRVS